MDVVDGAAEVAEVPELLLRFKSACDVILGEGDLYDAVDVLWLNQAGLKNDSLLVDSCFVLPDRSPSLKIGNTVSPYLM